MAICSLVVLITILSQPSLILVGLFLAAMWAASMRVDEVRLPGQIVLAGRNKLVALSTLSGVVLFIFAGTTIFCESRAQAHALEAGSRGCVPCEVALKGRARERVRVSFSVR